MKEGYCGRLQRDQVAGCAGRIHLNGCPKSGVHFSAWNKGKLIGQKPPLKLKEVWAIRTRLQMEHNTRDLALFNLAIDSKLRSCDLPTYSG